MGHYTYFRMHTIPAGFEQRVREAIAPLALQAGSDCNPFADDAESTKWYDHEDDFIAVSSSGNLTNIAIVVDGDGDENDVWRKVFLNGALVWRWTAMVTAPNVPDEIIARTDDKARGLREARLTGLTKLTETEIEALGIGSE